jgi:Membrane-bound lysozyme-inhibitor of c-type lysozyme
MMRRRSRPPLRRGIMRLSKMMGLAALAAARAAGSPAARAEAREEPEEATIRRVVFLCPRGTLLTVEFLNTEPGRPAIVHPPAGTAITLAPQPSGSGFRYGDETRELRGKGREVTWSDAGAPPIVCTERVAPPGGTEPN